MTELLTTAMPWLFFWICFCATVLILYLFIWIVFKLDQRQDKDRIDKEFP